MHLQELMSQRGYSGNKLYSITTKGRHDNLPGEGLCFTVSRIIGHLCYIYVLIFIIISMLSQFYMFVAHWPLI